MRYKVVVIARHQRRATSKPEPAEAAPSAPAATAHPPATGPDLLALVEQRLLEVRALQQARSPEDGTRRAWGPVARAWLHAAETIARGDVALGVARGREAADLEASLGAPGSPHPLPTRLPAVPCSPRAVPRAIRTLVALIEDAPGGGPPHHPQAPLHHGHVHVTDEPDDDVDSDP